MVVSSAGLRPKSDCSGNFQKQLYSKLQTRPLVREDTITITNPQLFKENAKESKKIGHSAQMGSRHQDRLAD
jgi:hypothetical protein